MVLKVRVRPGKFRSQPSTLGPQHWDSKILIDPNVKSQMSMEWLLDGNSLARADAVIVGVM